MKSKQSMLFIDYNIFFFDKKYTLSLNEEREKELDDKKSSRPTVRIANCMIFFFNRNILYS